MSKTKVTIIQTHPIQHFCPQFTSYAKLDNIELNVIFASKKGLEPYFDKNFKKEIKWDDIDLSSFTHTFLENNSVTTKLTEIDPDVIIIYGYANVIQKEALQWGNQYSKKTFYVSDSENHQKREKLKQFAKRIILKRFFRKIDICLSVGDANEDFYKWCGVSKKKLVRMFFPIDLATINEILVKKEKFCSIIYSKYNIEQDSLVISTVGKLVSWKSQIDIIYLLKELENRNIKCTAFLIGSGPDYEQLKEKSEILNSNKVIFTGFIQPKEMLQYIAATDIYVHPAKIEPHSLAISEAIYLGCPAIISDKCGSYGPTDDVQLGKNGYVYTEGNIKDLADKVEYLYKNNETLLDFSKASSKIGEAHQKLAHGEALLAAINIIEQS